MRGYSTLDLLEPAGVSLNERFQMPAEIFYYSRFSNTRFIAEQLAEVIGAGLVEIKKNSGRKGSIG